MLSLCWICGGILGLALEKFEEIEGMAHEHELTYSAQG